MKTIRKSLIFILIFTTLIGSAFTVYADASEDLSQPQSNSVQPRAEETCWYYRTVDGVLQARLWSITYGKWLTDWIILE